MGFVKIILPILVGAVIGYCTNYIAIKMLFHPGKAIYIGKFQLPFTPGIIPKNQKRVANAVGEAVRDQLLTKDALLESLSADSSMISDLAASVYESDRRVADLFSGEEACAETIGTVSAALSHSIVEKVKQIDFNAAAAKVGGSAMASLKTASPMLGMLLNGNMESAIYDRLANAARTYIENNGESAARGLIEEYLTEQAGRPIGELMPSGSNREAAQAALENMIRRLAEKYGSDLLDKVDIKGIVARKIEEMDVKELEELVLSVMKQELQAVINLGALIGAVIGAINIFI